VLRESALLPPPVDGVEPDAVITAADSVKTTTAAGRRSLRDRFPKGVNWSNTVFLAAVHTGAVAAIWHFSWPGLILAIVLFYATGCIGVTIGYHRMLTHTGFAVSAPLRYFFTLCAMSSGQGSPLFWVATHRKHHVHSDLPDDPHSPNDGFWWSHVLWLQPRETADDLKALFSRWAPDLYKNPVHRFLDRVFPIFLVLTGVALYFLGEAWSLLDVGATWAADGWSFLLWGYCLRMVTVYHTTWFVNSATHIWGYRNYETSDRSRNLWWVGLLAFGEGWHNNHHAHQRLARHGHRWFEFDLTYGIIWVMKKLRIARNVFDEVPHETMVHSGSIESRAPSATHAA